MVNSPPEVTGAKPGEGEVIHDVLVNTGATTMTVFYIITPTENGCTGDDLPVDVEVLPALRAYDVTGGGSLCEGDVGVVVGLSDSQPNINYALHFNGTNTGTVVQGRGGPLAFPFPVNHAGEYTAVGTIVGKCETPMTGTVAVVVNTTPQGTGAIIGESDICEGTSASYAASGWTNADNYRWTLSPELSGASADAEQKEVMADVPGTATMIVEPHNPCGTGRPAQKSITINPKPTGTLVAPEKIYVGTPFIPTFETTAAIAQWQWTFGDGDVAQQSQPEKTYAQPGQYTLSVNVTDNRECTETTDTEIAVEEAPLLNVYSIKNVITANGDPENGFLFVENLDKFPANEVVLINRWGGEVFRQRHYANDWDARGSNGFLPAGNYVCIVRLTERGQTFSRTVTIVRD
ncbi:gliding motility-associated C-terminal domain-containing protein [Chryseolinea lacunae]